MIDFDYCGGTWGHHRFTSKNIIITSGKNKNRPRQTSKVYQGRIIMIRGATLIHGCETVRLAGYQHIPGN